MMQILTILRLVMTNYKSLFKVVCGLSAAFLIALCVNLSKQNKNLSESLKTAQNNIEAYQGIVSDSQQANNVLRLDIETLHEQNDKLLKEVDSVRNELKIKPNQINTTATQTQVLYVNGGKGVEGDLTEILKDTTYTDSIKYNNLTTVFYTIGKDTVNIIIDFKNTQYLYVYSKKEYKNKKNLLQRIFTLDFKKINKYKYQIVNTNDMLKTEDVRIIESNQK